MRTVFPTRDLRDEAVERYHAVEDGQQTLAELAAYAVREWCPRAEGQVR